MVVDRITSLAEFEALRARWTELYASDGHAHVFLSWEWLSACFATDPSGWMVLGVREADGPYLSFLPLGYGRFPAVGPALDRELYLAGIPRADYTGMLALPGEEGRVVPALARAIESLEWDNFTLNDWRDERIGALIREFSPENYAAETAEPTPCPYLALPSTWDEYVQGKKGESRRNMRAKIRAMEALPGFRFRCVRSAADDGAEEAIETVLQLNSAKWNKSIAKRRSTFGGLFKRCLESERLVVKTIYDGNKPVASQCSFNDPVTRTQLGYMIGYDPEYAKLSPGYVLVCLSMRDAIEEGVATYDLSRGNEGYKKEFTKTVRYSHHTTLTRRGIRAAAVNAGRSGFFAAKAFARTLLGRSA
jgi:CelD/BcsL family acetyltransferase involved in cellulose biosynthesis